MRADGTQEMGAATSAPVFMQSISQTARPNSSPSATHFVSNSFNNTTWMPNAQTFQGPTGMPKTLLAPGPPGITSSVPPSNFTTQASTLDPSVPVRPFMSAAPFLANPSIQNTTVSMFPSSSLQAAPAGPWLQPQQISGFARPQFSPYAAVIPGPYPMPIRSMTPVSVPFPDIQPPGVSPAVSAVGSQTAAPTASFPTGGQLSVGPGSTELPPGTGKSEFYVLYFCTYESCYCILPLSAARIFRR